MRAGQWYLERKGIFYRHSVLPLRRNPMPAPALGLSVLLKVWVGSAASQPRWPGHQTAEAGLSRSQECRLDLRLFPGMGVLVSVIFQIPRSGAVRVGD